MGFGTSQYVKVKCQLQLMKQHISKIVTLSNIPKSIFQTPSGQSIPLQSLYKQSSKPIHMLQPLKEFLFAYWLQGKAELLSHYLY